MSNAVYAAVTDRIVKQLEQGTVPWRKPWTASGFCSQNLKSGHVYSGINRLVTSGWAQPYFLTIKQCNELGSRVKKAEHGTPIVYWMKLDKEKNDGTRTDFMLPRFYKVWNVSQIDLSEQAQAIIDAKGSKERDAVELRRNCESTILGYMAASKLKIQVGGSDSAHYAPKLDQVVMPSQNQFKRDDDFYSVFFHELTHSTGHETRLKREGIENVAAFGSETYSKEELVAELGAAFLCADHGIDNTIEQSAAYIKNWLKNLKDDPKMLVTAASQAEKAAKLIRAENEAES